MTAPNLPAYQRILGIRFFVGDAEAAVQLGLAGGLVVVPAAPALVELRTNKPYREALLNADLVITDSGLMVLIWRLLTGQMIPRVSGLKYLRLLLDRKALASREAVLWIMPGTGARDQNLAWLRSQGYDFTEQDCYLAPHYPPGLIVDQILTGLVKQRKPRHIVVCLGAFGTDVKTRVRFSGEHPLHWRGHRVPDGQPGGYSDMGGPIFSRLAFPLPFRANKVRAALLESLSIGADDDPLPGEPTRNSSTWK
jgi:hypothetical protein